MPSPSTVLLRTQSDERLAVLVRAGHERAFEAIVERYRRPLLRACRRILPEARAEDALQQALVAAWNGLRRGDDVHDLRPWLYRIARNTALNQLRVAGYDLDELVETLSATHDPEEEVLRRAVVRQTLAAVAALPERQREALLRTAVEGRGQDEVARDLGLSDAAVRALVHRARVRVRAAATALVPLPLVTWAAGAGGTGAAVTIAKAGTLAVLAGGAVTVPAVIHERDGRSQPTPSAHASRPHERVEAAAVPAPAATARPAFVVTAPTRTAAAPKPTRSDDDGARHERRVSGHRGSGDGDDEDEHARSDDDSSGPGGGGGDDGSSEPVETSGHSGPGGGEPSSGGDDSGSGGSSGPGGGGGDDAVAAPTATPTPTPVATTSGEDHHVSGGGGGGGDRSGHGDGDD